MPVSNLSPFYLNLIFYCEENSKFLSISCKIVAHFCFTTQDIAIKLISGNYALYQIILIRSILAILYTLLVFVPIDGGFNYLLTTRLGLQLLRGFGIVISNLCFFTALVTLPLGEAVAIFFVAPLMITALSVFIIREKVGLSSWIAVLVGLLGVLIILRPGFEEFNPGYILPLVAALAYALVQIITGKLGKKRKGFFDGLLYSVDFYCRLQSHRIVLRRWAFSRPVSTYNQLSISALDHSILG